MKGERLISCLQICLVHCAGDILVRWFGGRVGATCAAAPPPPSGEEMGICLKATFLAL